MSICSIPTKADDAKYDNLVDKYEDMGPIEDPAFQEAIKILRQSSPTQLHAEMRACKRGGKRRAGRTVGGKRRHRGRSRKARGGEGEDDELATPARAESMGPTTATVGTATEAEVPESKPAPAGTSKTMCYLRAMAKLSAMTAMLAGVAFNYIAPSLQMRAVSSLAKGLWTKPLEPLAPTCGTRLTVPCVRSNSIWSLLDTHR